LKEASEEASSPIFGEIGHPEDRNLDVWKITPNHPAENDEILQEAFEEASSPILGELGRPEDSTLGVCAIRPNHPTEIVEIVDHSQRQCNHRDLEVKVNGNGNTVAVKDVPAGYELIHKVQKSS
jgi:hypothetical protein